MDSQLEEHYLKNIILRLKMKEIVKKWKKKVKKSKHRKLVLHEMCTSERVYINSLKKLKNQFENPLIKLKVLSQSDFMFVFSSLDAIISLAEEMLARMEEVQSKWDPITTVISKPLQQLQKYFKLYKDYCKNYMKSSEIILAIEKHPQVAPLLKAFEPSGILDFLVKPTQRPFKYPLLIRQYLHDLPSNHLDYKNLQKTKEIYSKLCDELNDSMQAQTKMKEMIQLEKTFGDCIFQSSRQLKSKFIANHFDIECKVFVFNDVLMIAKVLSNNKLQQFMKIYLDGGSYVLKRQNNKNFQNRIYICGIQYSIHLVFFNQHERDSAYSAIQKVITTRYQNEFNKEEILMKVKMQRETAMMRSTVKLKYQWSEQKFYKFDLIITVVGAEQRVEKTQQKVVYFVKFQLKKGQDIYQIITLDIEQLKGIQNYLRTLYPRLPLPSLEWKSKTIFGDEFKNDFTKFIQYRSQHIESFLNYILRTNQVCQRPQLIMQRLKIHEYLWLALNKYTSECGCNVCLKSQVFTNIDIYAKELHQLKQKKNQFCISKAINLSKNIAQLIDLKTLKRANLQQRLLWTQCKLNRINHQYSDHFSYGKTFNLYVYIPSFVEEIRTKIQMINSTDTVRNVIDRIAHKRGYETTRDLALVLSSSKQQYILDDDEYIGEVEKFIQNQTHTSMQRSTFFMNLSKNFQRNQQKQEWKLTLRKICVFDKNIEEESCQANLQRYEIVIGEILKKFRNGLMILNVNDAKVFCALFYGIQEYNAIMYSSKMSFNEEKLHHYLPKTKWNYISSDFKEQIQQIIQKQSPLWNKVEILYRCIIRQFGDKMGWITQSFQVENTEPQTLLGGNRFVLLGISHKKVVVIPRNSNAILLQFNLNTMKYRVSGEAIFINTQTREYRFNGKNLFFFEKLVNIYRLMNEID